MWFKVDECILFSSFKTQVLSKCYLCLKIQHLPWKDLNSYWLSRQFPRVCSVLCRSHTRGLQSWKDRVGYRRFPSEREEPSPWVPGNMMDSLAGRVGRKERRKHTPGPKTLTLLPGNFHMSHNGLPHPAVYHRVPKNLHEGLEPEIRQCMNIHFPPNRTDRRIRWDNVGRCTWHVSQTTKVCNHSTTKRQDGQVRPETWQSQPPEMGIVGRMCSCRQSWKKSRRNAQGRGESVSTWQLYWEVKPICHC